MADNPAAILLGAGLFFLLLTQPKMIGRGVAWLALLPLRLAWRLTLGRRT